MNRLTYKLDEPIKTKYLNYEYKRIPDYDINRGNYGRISDDMIFNKLGKLEDIEEELGIDLIKAIELCKQVNIKKVVYTKDEWGYYPIKFIDELDIELFSHRLYKNARGICLSLDLYDYGKTWALTKEELENDN